MSTARSTHTRLFRRRSCPFMTYGMLFLLLMGVTMTIEAAPPLAITDYALAVRTEISREPAQIILQWPADPRTQRMQLYRRVLGEHSWPTVATAVVPPTETRWVDTGVQAGIAYEYRIDRVLDLGEKRQFTAYTYRCVGIGLPLVETRGTVLLIVEETIAKVLAPEIDRLAQDLIGDGWQVKRLQVASTATPPDVKALIAAEDTAAPGQVRAVLLLGQVPLPRAGWMNPDGHEPRPWPADAYYGDLQGTWTDTKELGAGNHPGDGIFDQERLPAPIRIMVGRIDLSRLPAFAPATEVELLRRYLEKNHRYRHKALTAEPRGMICDNFGVFNGEAFAQNGWRNFTALLDPEKVEAGKWSALQGQTRYLWAYGCGAGGHSSCAGVGNTGDFAKTAPRAIFSLLFGSYFGQWNTENNLLRAALATDDAILTCGWAGRPNWFVHHMAIDAPIGMSLLATQNNQGEYLPTNSAPGGIHIALMGDPTLRQHIIAPPTAVVAVKRGTTMTLSWQPSGDPVLGYHVYAADQPEGPYQQVTKTLLTTPKFRSTARQATRRSYLVRAVALRQGPGGSFYLASQGIIAAPGTAH